MARLEGWYWWFVGRRYIVRGLMRRYWRTLRACPLILDLGCGTGGNLPLLRSFGKVVAVDVTPFALRYARRHRPDALLSADACHLPFSEATFDLIAVLDVLEHLDDDRLALKEIARILRPGGCLIFTVPAFMSLWSVHDIALAHRRRYLLGDLREKILGAGFHIRHLSFALCPVFPAVFVFRKVQNLVMRHREPKTALIELPDPLNRLLISFLRAEALLLPYFPLPFGVSLVGIAEKVIPKA